DVVAHHERRPTAHPRVEASPDRQARVLNARWENADTHFAPTRRRQRSVNPLQAIGIAAPVDLNNAIAHWFLHLTSPGFCGQDLRPGRRQGPIWGHLTAGAVRPPSAKV